MQDEHGQHQRSKLYGKYLGTVVDLKDPQGRGRVRVTVPQVFIDKDTWADPCVPFAGKDVGFFFLPKVGTMVWVEFQAGEATHPIWTGCLWVKNDIAEADRPGATPDIKFLKTEKFMIRIDDAEGTLTITVRGDNGSNIVIDANQIAAEANTISNKASSKKTELTGSSFSVNDGALEVT